MPDLASLSQACGGFVPKTLASRLDRTQPNAALLSGSPAIDAGNTALTLNQDTRGVFASPPRWLYPRLDLLAGIADIGAYEVQQDDVVFNAPFERCADLPFVPPG